MSATEKGNPSLKGQQTKESADAVSQQRELKKQTDRIRKLEKRLKSIAPDDADREKLEQELEEAKAFVQRVSGPSSSSSAPVSDPVATPAPVPAAPTPAAAGAKENLSLKGQQTKESADAVSQQREQKKLSDRIRKLEKRLKDLTPEDADRAKLEQELEEAKALAHSKGGSASPKVNPSTVPPSPAITPTPAALPHVTAEEEKHKVEAARKKTEEDQAKAEAVEESIREMLKHTLENTVKASQRAPLAPPPHASPIIHPRIAETALLMEKMLVVGGNARTLALISAFRELIKSTTSLNAASITDINSDLFTDIVETNFKFLCRKREASSGMRYVKETLLRRLVAQRDTQAGSRGKRTHEANEDSRTTVLHILDSIETELTLSISSIVEERSMPYVSNTDTILVFGRSSVVECILLSRARLPLKKPKRVIVLDSAPLFEGRELAHKLSEAGICVTYGLLTSCCTLMSKCTRVFIGASSVLQNGDVFARCGTAIVAACAKSFRKPVLCLCESYKFVAEVWVGNLGQNTTLQDMGPCSEAEVSATLPNSVNNTGSTKSPRIFSNPNTNSPFAHQSPTWNAPPKNTPSLRFLTPSSSASGFLYDLTPAAYVDMIICEMGCLHTSAIVAAIKNREGRDEFLVGV